MSATSITAPAAPAAAARAEEEDRCQAFTPRLADHLAGAGDIPRTCCA